MRIATVVSPYVSIADLPNSTRMTHGYSAAK
jgi:hypothetical protein